MPHPFSPTLFFCFYSEVYKYTFQGQKCLILSLEFLVWCRPNPFGRYIWVDIDCVVVLNVSTSSNGRTWLMPVQLGCGLTFVQYQLVFHVELAWILYVTSFKQFSCVEHLKSSLRGFFTWLRSQGTHAHMEVNVPMCAHYTTKQSFAYHCTHKYSCTDIHPYKRSVCKILSTQIT